jgi:hypothetical protein
MYLYHQYLRSYPTEDLPLTELDGSKDTSDHEADTGETKCKVEWLPSWFVPQRFIFQIPMSSASRIWNVRDLHSNNKDNPHGAEQGKARHLDGDTSEENITSGLSLADIVRCRKSTTSSLNEEGDDYCQFRSGRTTHYLRR